MFRKTSGLIVLVTILVMASSNAIAACKMDGTSYETGTVKEGFICTASGKWKKL